VSTPVNKAGWGGGWSSVWQRTGVMEDNVDKMFLYLHFPQALHVLLPCLILLHIFEKLTCSWLVVEQGSVFFEWSEDWKLCFVCLCYEVTFGMSAGPNPIPLNSFFFFFNSGLIFFFFSSSVWWHILPSSQLSLQMIHCRMSHLISSSSQSGYMPHLQKYSKNLPVY